MKQPKASICFSPATGRGHEVGQSNSCFSKDPARSDAGIRKQGLKVKKLNNNKKTPRVSGKRWDHVLSNLCWFFRTIHLEGKPGNIQAHTQFYPGQASLRTPERCFQSQKPRYESTPSSASHYPESFVFAYCHFTVRSPGGSAQPSAPLQHLGMGFQPESLCLEASEALNQMTS